MDRAELPYDTSPSNERTLGELIIKTVATHIFAITNYAFLCTLQRRPTGNYLHVLRVILFSFVPTLLVVELVSGVVRAFLQFDGFQMNEEHDNAWYYVSAALGVHGTITDENPDNSTKESRKLNLPLLQLDSTLVERHRSKRGWGYVGKLLLSLFALTQGVGTIVMWVRRIDNGYPQPFDHRNGAMGIASSLCSIVSTCLIFMRFDWEVSRSFHPPASHETRRFARVSLLTQAFMALWLHTFIAVCVGDSWSENRWLYSSTGIVFELFWPHRRGFWSHWEIFVLFIVLVVLRRDIANRLSSDSITLRNVIKHEYWRKMKGLLFPCLALWLVVDVVKLFVVNIVWLFQHQGDYGYWWQDPISDKIFVI